MKDVALDKCVARDQAVKSADSNNGNMQGSIGAKRAVKGLETIGCIRRSHSTPAAMREWKRSQSCHAFENDSSKMEEKDNSSHPVRRRDDLITSLTHRSMTRSVEDTQMLYLSLIHI